MIRAQTQRRTAAPRALRRGGPERRPAAASSGPIRGRAIGGARSAPSYRLDGPVFHDAWRPACSTTLFDGPRAPPGVRQVSRSTAAAEHDHVAAAGPGAGRRPVFAAELACVGLRWAAAAPQPAPGQPWRVRNSCAQPPGPLFA